MSGISKKGRTYGSKTLVLLILSLFSLFELNLAAGRVEFFEKNFNEFFSKKLKLERDPTNTAYRVVVRDTLKAEDEIFRLPATHIIKSSDPFPYSAEVEKSLHELRIEDNVSETLYFLLRLLLGKLEEERNDFKTEFLNSLPLERDTILWWSKEQMQYFRNETYFYNQIWIQNMVDETESIIKLAVEVIESLEKKSVISS
jgi:hypothetical protein